MPVVNVLRAVLPPDGSLNRQYARVLFFCYDNASQPCRVVHSSLFFAYFSRLPERERGIRHPDIAETAGNTLLARKLELIEITA